MVWGTYAVKIEVQMAFASVKEGVKASGCFMALMHCQNGDLINLLK